MRFGLLLVENYLAYARVTQDHYLEQHPSDDEKSYGSRTSSTNNTLQSDSNSCHGAGSTSTLPFRAAKPMAPILFRPDLWVPNSASRRDSAEAPLASRTELC